jgi:hypothetical protein
MTQSLSENGGFLLKRWTVSVTWSSGTITSADIEAPTRGKAMADAWRSDVFNGSTFGEFLRFARARRAPEPRRFGDEIMVLGKPAFFIENNRQYVRFAWPGNGCVFNAHPYDVEPEEYRPSTYRSAAA